MSILYKILRSKRDAFRVTFVLLLAVLLWNSYYALKILERNRLIRLLSKLEAKNDSFAQTIKEKMKYYGITFEPEELRAERRDQTDITEPRDLRVITEPHDLTDITEPSDLTDITESRNQSVWTSSVFNDISTSSSTTGFVTEELEYGQQKTNEENMISESRILEKK